MIEQLAAPARAVGGFVEMSLDTFVKIFRRPFQFREFLDQTWMIARVSLVPTLLVAIPFTVLVAFTLNILLRETRRGRPVRRGHRVRHHHPARPGRDGARRRRRRRDRDLRGPRRPHHPRGDRRDAGARHRPDPAPRRARACSRRPLVALLLNGLVCAIGLAGGYVFSVFLQGVNPGAFINGLTILTGLGELVLADVQGPAVRRGGRAGRLLPRADGARAAPRASASPSTRPWSTPSSVCS